MRERDKKSYPQFEGRLIKWINSNFNEGKPIYGRVVGADYHIGVTIVNDSNPDQYLTCSNGPGSVQGKVKIENVDRYMEKYDIGFQFFLNVMRSNGVYNVDEKKDTLDVKGFSQSGKMSTCSYSK
jgi:hypothetical protein